MLPCMVIKIDHSFFLSLFILQRDFFFFSLRVMRVRRGGDQGEDVTASLFSNRISIQSVFVEKLKIIFVYFFNVKL